MANGHWCIARGIHRHRKSEQIGRQGELQPMQRLKPKANSHTTTTTNCGSQRKLTDYSFQPYLTISIRSSTSGRLMPPARSTWPKAMLIPSIEICSITPQSVPLNNISSLCRYSQHSEYQRKCDIGKWPRMHRPRKPTKSEIGTNWSSRRAATDVKAKPKEQLPYHH